MPDNENDDLRAALSSAFDEVESRDEPAPAPSPEDAVKEAPTIGGDERPRDEQGRFVKVEEKPAEPQKPVEEKPAEPQKPAEEKPAEPQKPAEEKPAESAKPPVFSTDGARAPQSWKPTIREKFKDLPPDVQEEVSRVDREVRRTMQESAEARQSYQRIREIFAPAEPFLRAQGLDYHSFTSDAVQTAMALAAGPQPTKAQAIARLIQIYGVDIPTLDSVLTSTMGQPGAAPTAAPPTYRDPRVDELYNIIQTGRQERMTALEEQARGQLSEVEKLEFFEDLREDMADLLDLAAKRNLALTPEEAYHRAALMHPEISKVLEQREAARKAVTASAATQRARAAASSIRGSAEASVPADTQPRDLRGDISAAWDAGERSR